MVAELTFPKIVPPMQATVDAGKKALVTSQEILVSDIRLAAYIGVHAYEQGRRQTLAVDARVVVRPIERDELAATTDYNIIVAAAIALSDQRIALIETFARRLAAYCIQQPDVLQAEVIVRKPSALPNGLVAARVVLDVEA
jgi:7,8-dihydroneopterin aldolase/epimerase/oxygenase